MGRKEGTQEGSLGGKNRRFFLPGMTATTYVGVRKGHRREGFFHRGKDWEVREGKHTPRKYRRRETTSKKTAIYNSAGVKKKS